MTKDIMNKMADPRGERIEPSYGFHVIPYGNLPDQNGYQAEIHDSFKTDRYGNEYSGHTTVNLEGEKFDIPWS